MVSVVSVVGLMMAVLCCGMQSSLWGFVDPVAGPRGVGPVSRGPRTGRACTALGLSCLAWALLPKNLAQA
jgi:hypothetical protein